MGMSQKDYKLIAATLRELHDRDDSANWPEETRAVRMDQQRRTCHSLAVRLAYELRKGNQGFDFDRFVKAAVGD